MLAVLAIAAHLTSSAVPVTGPEVEPASEAAAATEDGRTRDPRRSRTAVGDVTVEWTEREGKDEAEPSGLSARTRPFDEPEDDDRFHFGVYGWVTPLVLTNWAQLGVQVPMTDSTTLMVLGEFGYHWLPTLGLTDEPISLVHGGLRVEPHWYLFADAPHGPYVSTIFSVGIGRLSIDTLRTDLVFGRLGGTLGWSFVVFDGWNLKAGLGGAFVTGRLLGDLTEPAPLPFAFEPMLDLKIGRVF